MFGEWEFIPQRKGERKSCENFETDTQCELNWYPKNNLEGWIFNIKNKKNLMNNKVKRIIDSYIKIGIEKISNINISNYYNLIDSKNIPYDNIFKLYNYAILKNNIIIDKKLSKKIKKYSYFFDMEYQPIIYSTMFLLSFLDLKDKFSLYNDFINEIDNIEILENNLITDLEKIIILNKKMNSGKNVLLNFIDIFKQECSYEIDNLDIIIQEK